MALAVYLTFILIEVGICNCKKKKTSGLLSDPNELLTNFLPNQLAKKNPDFIVEMTLEQISLCSFCIHNNQNIHYNLLLFQIIIMYFSDTEFL